MFNVSIFNVSRAVANTSSSWSFSSSLCCSSHFEMFRLFNKIFGSLALGDDEGSSESSGELLVLIGFDFGDCFGAS